MEVFKAPPSPQFIEGRSQVEHAKLVMYWLVQLHYESTLSEFLAKHILSVELDYIDLIDAAQKENLSELKQELRFWPEDDEEFDYENKVSLDEYWFFTSYQRFLVSRRAEIAVPITLAPAYYLDIPATLAGRNRLPIDDVLAIPRAALDLILLDAAMIEPDTIPGRYKAKPTVKPWQWANVRAALLTKLLLAEINDLDAARLFTETYGAKVGRGTMQLRPQNEQNSKFKTRRVLAYAEFYDRLPAPNPS